MKAEKKTLTFGITGEFITQITREWFYSGEKSIEKVMEILKDCMTGTDAPESKIRRYVEDILLGRAALKGSTADGTYHLERYEPGEEKSLPRSMNIWKIPQLRREAEEKLKEMNEQFVLRWSIFQKVNSEQCGENLGWKHGKTGSNSRLMNF